MKRFARPLLIALISLPLLGATERADKKALIHQLMGVIGAEDLAQKAVQEVMSGFKRSYEPETPDEEGRKQYEESQKREEEERNRLFQRIDFAKYAEQLFLPVFDRYTVSELTDAIAYYKTPSGQKSVQLLAESSELGFKALSLMRSDLKAVDAQLRAEDRAKEEPWKRTMADLRSLATASEAYATDENHYPRAETMDDLSAIIAPTYIRETPKKDGWGNDYVYMATPDLQHYRFVSAGSDGVLDFDSRTIAIDTQLQSQHRVTTDFKEDIIYQDGAFVRYPKQADPKNE